MQVNIDKEYPIAADIDSAWKVMADIRELASCMPGAEITEQIGPDRYKGNMKIKVGPASASFGGEIEVLELSPQQRQVRFKGKGAERGGSSASMDLSATLLPGESAQACRLAGKAEVTVSGKFAQFGSRMMGSVSDMMLERFVQNFSHKASLLVPAAAPAAAAPLDDPTLMAADAPARSAAAPPPPPAPAPLPAGELNAFSLLWEGVKRFFAGLLHSKK